MMDDGKLRGTGELPPWDTEWAAERAAEGLRYLRRNYPECLENLRVLDEHEEAANEAAARGGTGMPTSRPSGVIAEPGETRRCRYGEERRDDDH